MSTEETDDSTKYVVIAAIAFFFLRGSSRSARRNRANVRASFPAAVQTRSDTPREEWWLQTYDLALQAAEEFLPNSTAAQHRLFALAVATLAANETGQGESEWSNNPGNLVSAPDATGRAMLPGNEVYAVFADTRAGVRAMARLLASASRYRPALQALLAPRSLTAAAAIPAWAYAVSVAGYTEPAPARTRFQEVIRRLVATGQRILSINDAQLQG